ncbi:hypothetical protein ACWD4J_04010 [Streptomyces sp. NPDC002577]
MTGHQRGQGREEPRGDEPPAARPRRNRHRPDETDQAPGGLRGKALPGPAAAHPATAGHPGLAGAVLVTAAYSGPAGAVLAEIVRPVKAVPGGSSWRPFRDRRS